MERVSRIMTGLAFAFAAAAGVALVYMMILTVTDILGRNIGLFTIDSGVEQAELLMAIIAFFALAQCIRTDTNIVVDVATVKLPGWINRLIDACWNIVYAAVLVVLAYLVFRNGLQSANEGQHTELLNISPLVGHGLAAMGMAVAVVVAIHTAVSTFVQRRRSADELKSGQ